MARKISFILIIFLLSVSGTLMCTQPEAVFRIKVSETAGMERDLEYVEISVDLPAERKPYFIAKDHDSGEVIPCQMIWATAGETQTTGTLVFPVTLAAGQSRVFDIFPTNDPIEGGSELVVEGEGLEITVENIFYRADMTRSDQSEAKSHSSGQLRELLLKMDYDVMLFRTENRMHWAPNFQRSGVENYNTIAGWENPRHFQLISGPYMVRTERKDAAPDYPEIMLSSTYSFYAGLPYFRFSSEMQMTEDINLQLLRNDEMTMDSLFTHVAFQRPDGQIEDLSFAEREARLKEKPLEADANWLCFYHAQNGYAWGSIRLTYDNRNLDGTESPIYNAHTKISNGAEGGKYWNRRLIDEKPTMVPKGSRYLEENAYIVFSIDEKDKFAGIENRYKKLKNPLQVALISQ